MRGSTRPGGRPRCREAVSMVLAALAAWVAPSHAADTAPPSAGQEIHSTQCVAALQAETESLAALVRQGRADLRPLLLQRLNQGASFIGKAYLSGERDEEHAKALLKSATADLANLRPAELEARQAACAVEGSHLIGRASAFERFVLSRLAERRLKKLLGE